MTQNVVPDAGTATPRRIPGRSGLVLLLVLAVTGFYLLAEHRAHVFDALPWLLLLACLLMHFFMHGSHGGHGGTPNEGRAGRPDDRH